MKTRPISGFPMYSISENGDVYSSFGGTIKKLKPGISTTGYKLVILTNKEGKKTKKVHCLVAEAFLGKRPEGLDINHKDGDKLNNQRNNLEYVTRSENNKHAIRRGLSKPIPPGCVGERNGQSKLTEKDVREIRQIESLEFRNIDLGKTYGVSASVISEVRNYKAWKHVK